MCLIDFPTPCVLFGRAKGWQKREQWIAMRKRTEEAAAA